MSNAARFLSLTTALVLTLGFASTVAAQGSFVDTFEAVASDDQVTIIHGNAEYNCVQDAFVYEIMPGEGGITVTENEDPPGGYADCICYFELEVVLEDLPAGPLHIEFLYLDYGGEGWTTVGFDLVIGEVGQGGSGAVTSVLQSDCHEGNPVGLVPTDWATIRRMFH